jgi:hypothetical protein
MPERSIGTSVCILYDAYENYYKMCTLFLSYTISK